LKALFVLSRDSIWKYSQYHRILLNELAFTSSTELLFGCMMLYQFRMFERLFGTRKYAAFIVSTFALTSALKLLTGLPVSQGPYTLIFAQLALYYAKIPQSYSIKVLLLQISDKGFMYLLGLQLLTSSYPSSFYSGLFGLLSGFVYSAVPLLSKWRFPVFVDRLCSRFLLPLLDAPQQKFSTGGASTRSAFITSPRSATGANASLGLQTSRANANAPDNFISGASSSMSGLHRRNVNSDQFTVVQPSEDNIQVLTGMGFERSQAVRALERSGNNLDRATNILLDAS
jgi:hypothetical protein